MVSRLEKLTETYLQGKPVELSKETTEEFREFIMTQK
jgi:hypothetical protein